MAQVSKINMGGIDYDIRDKVLEQEVANIKPIINQGTINNAADEEDLTSENNLLKLKDRSALNGIGYVILRKNKTFAEQVTKANTIYEIRYDFDLRNNTIELPENVYFYFCGGKIVNGNLVANHRLANTELYAKDFDFGNDTNLLKFLFEQARMGVRVFLENRIYNINTSNQLISLKDRIAGHRAFIFCDGVKGFYLDGNGAELVNDLSSDVTNSLYVSLIEFFDSSDVTIKNISLKGTAAEVGVNTEKVSGQIFVQVSGNCDNFNIDIKGEKLGRVFHADSYTQPINSSLRNGLSNSSIKVDGVNVGYPIAIMRGDNLNIINNFDYAHRGLYLNGVTNSTIFSSGKNPVYTQVHCLLTNDWYNNERIVCDALDLHIHDTGSDANVVSGVTILAVSSQLNDNAEDNELIKQHYSAYISASENANVTLTSFDTSYCDHNYIDADIYLSNVKANIDIARFSEMPHGNIRFHGFGRKDKQSFCLMRSSAQMKDDTQITFYDCHAVYDIQKIQDGNGDIAAATKAVLRWERCGGKINMPIEGCSPKVEISDNRELTITGIKFNLQTDNISYQNDLSNFGYSLITYATLSSSQSLVPSFALPLGCVYMLQIYNSSASQINITMSGSYTMAGSAQYLSIPANSHEILLICNTAVGVNKLRFEKLRMSQFNNLTYLNDIKQKMVGDMCLVADFTRAGWWTGSRWIDADGFELRAKVSNTRPSLGSVDAGFTMYDSSAKKMILWNGGSWVNMDGSAL